MFNTLNESIKLSNEKEEALRSESSIFDSKEDEFFENIAESFGDIYNEGYDEKKDERKVGNIHADVQGQFDHYKTQTNDPDAHRKLDAAADKMHDILEKVKQEKIQLENEYSKKIHDAKGYPQKIQNLVKEKREKLENITKEFTKLTAATKSEDSSFSECNESDVDDFTSPTDDIFGRSDNDGFDSKLPNYEIHPDMPENNTIKQPSFPLDVPEDSVLLNDEDFSKDLENGMFECSTCGMSESDDSDDNTVDGDDDSDDSDEEEMGDFFDLEDPDDIDTSDLDDED